MKKYSILLFIVSILLASALNSCKMKNEDTGENNVGVVEHPGKESISNKQSQGPAIDCDTSLWKYVYNPDRLEVIAKCKTVVGVIEESNADEDGDQHMLLKLDNGQDELLTKRNRKKKDGDMVIEAVCANTVSLKKVGNTCQGYLNQIQIPKIGQHVKVTGSLVIDSHNGWAEIHPITKIEVVK